MRKTRLAPAGTNTFAVRVDSCVNGEMSGEFCAPGSSVAVAFSSLPGLILMIDEILDMQENDAVPAERPATFEFAPNIELDVLFRQNHTWQGCVRWLEEDREATFRSVLELMFIMETIFGD